MKIKDEERERAKRLAKSAAGATLEGDIQLEAREAATKTFIPGEGQSTKEAFITNFTPEQKMMIKQIIADAKNPADIEYIKNCVTRGEFPSILSNETTMTYSSTSIPLPPLPPPPSSAIPSSDINVPSHGNSKRKASEIGENGKTEEGPEKYIKLSANS